MRRIILLVESNTCISFSYFSAISPSFHSVNLFAKHSIIIIIVVCNNNNDNNNTCTNNNGHPSVLRDYGYALWDMHSGCD